MVQGRQYQELPVAAFLPPGDYGPRAAPVRRRRRTTSIRTGKMTSVALSVTPPLLTAAEPAARTAAGGGEPGVSRASAWPTRKTLHLVSTVSTAVGLTALVAGIALGSLRPGHLPLSPGAHRPHASGGGSPRRVRKQQGQRRQRAAHRRWRARRRGWLHLLFTLPEPGVQ